MQNHYTEISLWLRTNPFQKLQLKFHVVLMANKATDKGESKWITNKAVKNDVFHLRHKHDAVLTGRGTIYADNPQYTTRIEEGKHPIKVILSKTGEIDFNLDIFN